MIGDEQIPLEKFLGSGMTADVYVANQHGRKMAVKVLRANSDKVVRDNFESEYRNLTDLARAWSQEFSGYPLVIPEVYARDLGVQAPLCFIAMEFMSGEKLVDYIPSKGKLSEQQAFGLLSQFGKLLHVLHTRLKKCYADIKLENLWVLSTESPDKLQLKVTDWNVLSDYSEDGEQRDIFYASYFLYWALTGIKLSYRREQIGVKLDADPAFSSLSAPAQSFLRQALHASRGRRYKTAQAWYTAAAQIAYWWGMDASDLNNSAQAALMRGKAERDQGRLKEAGLAFEQALYILAISDRKGRGDRATWAQCKKELDEGLESTSSLEKGLLYLRGDSYLEAKNEFDAGADLSVLEPERLRRWYWLAAAAYDLGPDRFNPVKDRAIEAVNALLDDQPEAARDGFTGVAKKLGLNEPVLNDWPTGLRALYNEARILILANQAKSCREHRNYDESIQHYSDAIDIYQSLPKEPATAWAAQIGDLYELIKSTRNESESRGRADQEFAHAKQELENNHWEEAGYRFRLALLADPEDTRVSQTWSDALHVCMQKTGNLEAVLKLGEPANGLPGADKEIRPLLVIAHTLKKLHTRSQSQDLFVTNQHQSLLSDLNQFQESHAGDPFALGSVFEGILATTLESALKAQNWQYATEVIKIAGLLRFDLSSLWQSRLDQYKALLTEHRNHQSTALITEIIRQDQQGTLDAYKVAEGLMAELTRLHGGQLPIDLQSVITPIRQRAKILEEQTEGQREKRSGRISEIRTKLRAIDSQLITYQQLLEDLDRPDERLGIWFHRFGGVDGQRQILSQEQANLLAEGLSLALEWHHLDNADAEASSRVEDITKKLNETGLVGWQLVVNTGRQKIQCLEETRSKAESAYRSGDIKTAQEQLDSFNPQWVDAEMESIRKRIQEAKAFEAWVRDSNLRSNDTEIDSLITRIQEYAQLGIPSVYWKKSGLMGALNKILDGLLRRLPSSKKHPNAQELSKQFLSIVKCHQAELTVQRLSEELPPTLPDQTDWNLALGRFLKALRHKKDVASMRAALTLIGENAKPPQDLTGQLQKLEDRQQKMTIIGAVGVAFVALLIIGIGIWKLLPPGILAEHTPTPTSTPTIAITVIAVTTQPPTEAPTQIPTPEPTPTPTPIPASACCSDPALVGEYPLPAGVEFWVLMDGVLDPPTAPGEVQLELSDVFSRSYKTNESEGGIWQFNPTCDGLGSNCINLMGGGQNLPPESYIDYVLADTKVPQTGYYELFVLDPFDDYFSRTSYELDYTLWADGVEINKILPIGINGFKQENDKTPEWHSIGIYPLSMGMNITVRLDLSDKQLDQIDDVPSLDAVAIARVPDLTMLSPEEQSAIANLQNAISAEPELAGRKPLFWVDDADAERSSPENWTSMPEDVAPYTWNGALQAEMIAESPTTITWTLPHHLPAGTYEIWTWVPAGSSGSVMYTLEFDPQTGATSTDITPGFDPSISGMTAKLVHLYNLEVTGPDPCQLKVTLTGQEAGTMIGDVILIFPKLP